MGKARRKVRDHGEMAGTHFIECIEWRHSRRTMV
jgi:hypothetical protein